jgi:hypothetical protein
MTVIYFTDGALIEDVTVRRSLLRIPDILRTLKKSEKEFVNIDLFLAMNEIDVYNSLNYHQKNHLKTIIQNALFHRWMKLDIEPDLILKRADYPQFNDLTEIFRKLSTLESLHVVTIGPGFDELEIFLRLQLKLTSNPISDVIQQDPRLTWFWKDIRSQLQLNS